MINPGIIQKINTEYNIIMEPSGHLTDEENHIMTSCPLEQINTSSYMLS
jgi:hypothetical protein